MTIPAANQQYLDERLFGRLRWRCRRGMLENDLLIERFFERQSSRITQWQADALLRLMDLADNDLLDMLLRRRPLDCALDTPEMRQLLVLISPAPPLAPEIAPADA